MTVAATVVAGRPLQLGLQLSVAEQAAQLPLVRRIQSSVGLLSDRLVVARAAELRDWGQSGLQGTYQARRSHRIPRRVRRARQRMRERRRLRDVRRGDAHLGVRESHLVVVDPEGEGHTPMGESAVRVDIERRAEAADGLLHIEAPHQQHAAVEPSLRCHGAAADREGVAARVEARPEVRSRGGGGPLSAVAEGHACGEAAQECEALAVDGGGGEVVRRESAWPLARPLARALRRGRRHATLS